MRVEAAAYIATVTVTGALGAVAGADVWLFFCAGVGAFYSMVRLQDATVAQSVSSLLIAIIIGFGVAQGVMIEIVEMKPGVTIYLVAAVSSLFSQAVINKLHEQIGVLDITERLLSWVPKKGDK